MMSEQKQHVLKYLAKNIRFDGRKPLDYRDVTVEYGISKSAEGSARVRIGGTEVIAGVKISIEKPYPDTPDKGNLMVNAELRPMASPKFESGPPSDQGIELARVVDRGIRESECIDVHDLVIKEGELVWSVSIDIVAVNDEGNLFDAAGLAALAALLDARMPGKNEFNKADYDKRTDEKLPLKTRPVPITVFKIGATFLVDPLSDEEENFDARLTVACKDDGSLAALQKGGEGSLTIDEIDHMVGIALERSAWLREKLGR
ncbi:exosome complex protein Rrp42 [Candidatus Woesearchaeota archaeon]|nr:exosome complex protein Rrp42 [Candidatus Woesearchaeota archaeon]